jgi:hypothetical protein
MATYNLEISYNKMKNMAFHRKYHTRSKILLSNKTIAQIQNFNYLGCDIFFNYDNDLRQKIHKFQYACVTIKRILRNKTRKESVGSFTKSWLYLC